MRDLSVLKERIEYAERHLTASHTARERESHALMAMWQQIRDRFELQEQEIARYRAQLAEMTGKGGKICRAASCIGRGCARQRRRYHGAMRATFNDTDTGTATGDAE